MVAELSPDVKGVSENVDHAEYLLCLVELELIDRHQRMVERRIRTVMIVPGGAR